MVTPTQKWLCSATLFGASLSASAMTVAEFFAKSDQEQGGYVADLLDRAVSHAQGQGDGSVAKCIESHFMLAQQNVATDQPPKGLHDFMTTLYAIKDVDPQGFEVERVLGKMIVDSCGVPQ